jgi:transposase InsO family protein
VWVSPSTVYRVLARHNLHLAGETRPPKTVKKPWPAWTEWRPTQLWCWDGSQFEACEASKYAYEIIDPVSRKWITVTLTPEPNQVAVKVLFLKALAAEGLRTPELEHRVADPDAPPVPAPDVPPMSQPAVPRSTS